jgi:hypothetical protein
MPKSLKINFEAVAPWVLEHTQKPTSANSFLPSWYKDMKPFIDTVSGGAVGKPTSTMKRCQPLMDAFSAGYIISTWSDVYIGKNQNGHPTYGFEGQIPVITEHNNVQVQEMPFEDGFEKLIWKWTNVWSITTPKGYSSLIVHPLSVTDSPFKILSAVVDTDSPMPPINFPFMLKKGFTGLIRKGTPVAQIIPFKRDEWDSSLSVIKEQELVGRQQTLASNLFNSYRIMFHKKKSYR